MQQLIQQLTEQYNLSEEDATTIIDTVKNYVPANNADENSGEETEKQTTAAAQTTVAPVAQKEDGIFEKAENFVTDHLPGGMKEKAEEMLGGVGNKIKGLFS